jgi:microcompartment protein CcmL/EutN
VVVRGDVAAVKASVEAGTAAASAVGKITGQTVIPRPSDRIEMVFPVEPKKTAK